MKDYAHLIPEEIQNRIFGNLLKFVEIADQNGYPVVTPDLWYNKSHRAAGRCHSNKGIELSVDYTLQFTDEMAWNTLGHEFAHWIQFEMGLMEYTRTGRRKIHGPQFKALCRMLGVSDSTTHKMKLDQSKLKCQRKKQQRFNLKCGCESGVRVSKTIYNRIQRKTHTYWCKRCKENLSVVT